MMAGSILCALAAVKLSTWDSYLFNSPLRQEQSAVRMLLIQKRVSDRMLYHSRCHMFNSNAQRLGFQILGMPNEVRCGAWHIKQG